MLKELRGKLSAMLGSKRPARPGVGAPSEVADGDAIDRIARAHALTSHAALIREHALPSVAFTFDDVKRGWSQCGGIPLLPEGFEWPTYVPEGRSAAVPLDCLLQIDLDELSELEPARVLPRSGLLTFFYDSENQPAGFDPKHLDGFRVVLFEHDGLVATPPPHGARFGARRLRFWPATTVPSYDSIAYEKLSEQAELSDSYFEFTDELERLGYPRNAGLHRLLGHSSNIQGDMQLEAQLVTNGLYCGDAAGYNDPRRHELEKGAQDWVLLLQLDSDDLAQMCWGDVGMLYFWIRKQDLAARRFDRCWMSMQCT